MNFRVSFNTQYLHKVNYYQLLKKGFSVYSFLTVFSEDGVIESSACLHILKARHSILCMENIGIDGLRDVC